VTIDELRTRTTIDVPTASEVLGIGRRQGYAAAKAGSIPTLRLGGRLLVPVPKLLQMLGAQEVTSDERI
jgi:hypothetical protein